MKKITVFNHVTVDGFFAGPNGEIDWFQDLAQDSEWHAYTHRERTEQTTLVFGHTTYEMMKSFWPTEMARKVDSFMANVVNNSPKIVFSKTLQSVEEEPNWKNIRLFHDVNPEEILKLKEREDMTILGSGSIVQQFANHNLIDEYTLVVVPVILGNGKPLFKDVKMTNLKLLEAKSFKNGITLLHYQLARG